MEGFFDGVSGALRAVKSEEGIRLASRAVGLSAATIIAVTSFAFAANATAIVENFTAGSGDFTSTDQSAVLGTTSINQFDPSLGTLTSITFDITVNGTLNEDIPRIFPEVFFGPPDATGHRTSGVSFSTGFDDFSGESGGDSFTYTDVDQPLFLSSLVESFLVGTGTESFSFEPKLSSQIVTSLSITSISGSVTFTYTPTTTTAVPEPGTLAIFGTALAGLGLWRRRKV